MAMGAKLAYLKALAESKGLTMAELGRRGGRKTAWLRRRNAKGIQLELAL